MASEYGNVELALHLIEQGANRGTVNNNQQTCIMLAIQDLDDHAYTEKNVDATIDIVANLFDTEPRAIKINHVDGARNTALTYSTF